MYVDVDFCVDHKIFLHLIELSSAFYSKMMLHLLNHLVCLVCLTTTTTILAIPAIPPSPTPNSLQLQQNLNHAISNNMQQFHVPPGTYVFSNSSLVVDKAMNLIITAQDVTLVFFYGYGFLLSNACNVTIIGLLTFDADPPNYAQGVVDNEDIDPNNLTFSATFSSSFLLPDMSLPPFISPGGSAGAKVSFWDPSTREMLFTTNFLKSTTRHKNTAADEEDTTTFQVQLVHPQHQGLVQGALVTIYPRKGYTWKCANCSHVVVDSVTIHAGGNMGFLEVGGEVGFFFFFSFFSSFFSFFFYLF